MKARLSLGLSAVALVVALVSNGTLVDASTGVVRHALFADRANTARHASTADTAKFAQRAKTATAVAGIHASRNPVAGQLVPLGNDRQFPESVLPLDSTNKAPNIAARIWSSANQAIPSSAGGPSTPETYLHFDRIAFDTAGLFNASAADRLTVPVTGIYLVSATVYWAHPTGATPELVVRLIAGGKIIASEQVVGAFDPSQSVTGVERLVAGDTVQVVVGTHDDGTVITADGDSPSLSVVWLAPG
jgi:hypothetical protein